MPYNVLVDDNYHFMDETERFSSGTFATVEGAVARCRTIVDEFLEREHSPGISASELYDQYTTFGDDPFIISVNAPPVNFSAWDYARACCEILCPRCDGPTSPLVPCET